MSDNNNNSKNDDDDNDVRGPQRPASRMVKNLLGYNTSANGLKNTMSPTKHAKRRTKQPTEIYIPTTVAVTHTQKIGHFLRQIAV